MDDMIDMNGFLSRDDAEQFHDFISDEVRFDDDDQGIDVCLRWCYSVDALEMANSPTSSVISVLDDDLRMYKADTDPVCPHDFVDMSPAVSWHSDTDPCDDRQQQYTCEFSTSDKRTKSFSSELLSSTAAPPNQSSATASLPLPNLPPLPTTRVCTAHRDGDVNSKESGEDRRPTYCGRSRVEKRGVSERRSGRNSVGGRSSNRAGSRGRRESDPADKCSGCEVCEWRELTRRHFSNYFHLSRQEAADAMNISVTLLKRRCRKVGIRRWPYRKFRAVVQRINKLHAAPRRLTTLKEGPMCCLAPVVDSSVSNSSAYPSGDSHISGEGEVERGAHDKSHSSSTSHNFTHATLSACVSNGALQYLENYLDVLRTNPNVALDRLPMRARSH